MSRTAHIMVRRYKNEDIESLIKRFNRRVFKSGLRQEFFDKKFALSKSEKRRRKDKRARRRR